MLITRFRVVECREKWTFIIQDLKNIQQQQKLDQTSVFAALVFNEINLQFRNEHSVIKHQLHHKVGNDDNKNECLINA